MQSTYYAFAILWSGSLAPHRLNMLAPLKITIGRVDVPSARIVPIMVTFSHIPDWISYWSFWPVGLITRWVWWTDGFHPVSSMLAMVSGSIGMPLVKSPCCALVRVDYNMKCMRVRTERRLRRGTCRTLEKISSTPPLAPVTYQRLHFQMCSCSRSDAITWVHNSQSWDHPQVLGLFSTFSCPNRFIVLPAGRVHCALSTSLTL